MESRPCLYLYDSIFTHSLEWPSLTVEWLPSAHGGTAAAAPAGADWVAQSLIMGTHTSGAGRDYVMVTNMRLPVDDAADDDRFAFEFGDLNSEQTTPESRAEAQRRLAEGWRGAAAKVSISAMAPLDAEAHRVRHCPSRPSLRHLAHIR